MSRKKLLGFTLVQTVIAMGLVSMLLLAIMQGTTYVFKVQRNLAATKDFENYISEIEHYLSDSDTCRKVLRLDKMPQVSQIFDPNSNATNTNIVLYDPKTSGTSSSDEILKTGLTFPKFKIKSVSYTYEPPAGGAVGGPDVVYNGSDLTTYYVKVSVLAEKQGETIGAKEIKRDFFTSFFLSKATPPVLGQIQHCGGVFSKDALAQEACNTIVGAIWDAGTKKCYIDYCNNNGITETQYGEECDNGANNGVVCSAKSTGQCTYCSKKCKLITLKGVFQVVDVQEGRIGYGGKWAWACDGPYAFCRSIYSVQFCHQYGSRSTACVGKDGSMSPTCFKPSSDWWYVQAASSSCALAPLAQHIGSGVSDGELICLHDFKNCRGDGSWSCYWSHYPDGCDSYKVKMWKWVIDVPQ